MTNSCFNASRDSASLCVIVMGVLALAVFILGLPDGLAFARKHPEAGAIHLIGWIGLLVVVPVLDRSAASR